MRCDILECVVLCFCLISVATGCKQNPSRTKQSPGSRAAQSRDVEELRLIAHETDQNPPSESEDRNIVALWASISELAPPATFMGRNPLDKDVAEQNGVFIASEIALAVKEAGLDSEIPLALIRGTIEAAAHQLSREEREKLTGWEAPVRLNALACFLMMSNLIGDEVGYDQAGMYLQRMNLQVQLDRKQLILRTQMRGGERQAWPRVWLRLFTACFHRPLVILPTDTLRQELWSWIDGQPSIAVQASDASVLAAGTLVVPVK